MSHIACDAQRIENQAIWDCPHRSVFIAYTYIHPITGEHIEDYGTVNQCELEYLSVAQEKCKRCGKTFTY